MGRILALRHGAGTESMSDAEQARAVHAEHDLHLFAPIRPESELTTTATAIGIEQRTPGAYLIKRLDTKDQHGTLVCRTYQGTLYRGVVIAGAPISLETPPALPALDNNRGVVHPVTIGAGAAHTYTECARIWNPIHTDRAHALAAGLPDLILHGTATLARAVSVLVRHYLGGDPTRVRRIGCRFSGMVLMPSELRLVVESRAPSLLGFRVTNAQGQDVIKHGFVVSGPG
jgi:acyl dehydratase